MKHRHILSINEFFEQFYEKEEMLQEWVSYVLKQFGYNVPKPKWTYDGGNGDVYLMNDGTVIKITKDSNETYTAKLLMDIKENLVHFVKYYDIKSIEFENIEDVKLFKGGKPIPIYGLHMEKLKTFNENNKDRDQLIKVLSFFVCDHYKLGEKTHTYCNCNMETIETFLERNSLDRFKSKIGNDILSINYYNQLVEMMKEAKKHKIVMVDMDINNIGINSENKLVTFDLGGRSNIQNTESKLKELDIITIPNLKNK